MNINFKMPNEYKIKSLIISFLVYATVFPGTIKIYIGTSIGSVFNIVVFIFLIFSLLFFYSNKNLNKCELSYIIILVSYLFFVLLYSFNGYTDTHISIAKVVISSLISIMLIIYKPNDIASGFISWCCLFGCVTLIFGLGNLIDKQQVGVNYLTLTMPVCIIATIFFRRIFINSGYVRKILYILFTLLSIYYLSISGSRSSLIIPFAFIFVYTSIFFYKNNRLLFIILVIAMSGSFLSFLDVLKLFLEEKNSYLYTRLFDADSLVSNSLERNDIYSLVCEMILDSPALGHGVNAYKDILNIEYVESFPLELVLTFGVFIGAMFIFLIHYPALLKWKSKYNIQEVFIISVCVFLFFVKGWSLFDYSIQFIIMSLILIDNGVGSENKNC
ncbi:O-antigen ligase family protein [Vibrio cholerae]|uniref:O-antigen ligase family protein n=1 Tax=Vibrio cholerae TaxID=666 RepID=UPI001E3EBE1D|nr:O-antigen ligase family protein [Vibrio cholerae]MCD6730704.1 O-antigen ligase family protein [Vibrio cholerae]